MRDPLWTRHSHVLRPKTNRVKKTPTVCYWIEQITTRFRNSSTEYCILDILSSVGRWLRLIGCNSEFFENISHTWYGRSNLLPPIISSRISSILWRWSGSVCQHFSISCYQKAGTYSSEDGHSPAQTLLPSSPPVYNLPEAHFPEKVSYMVIPKL